MRSLAVIIVICVAYIMFNPITDEGKLAKYQKTTTKNWEEFKSIVGSNLSAKEKANRMNKLDLEALWQQGLEMEEMEKSISTKNSSKLAFGLQYNKAVSYCITDVSLRKIPQYEYIAEDLYKRAVNSKNDKSSVLLEYAIYGLLFCAAGFLWTKGGKSNKQNELSENRLASDHAGSEPKTTQAVVAENKEILTADQWFERGYDFQVNRQDYDAAIEAYTKAIAFEPRNSKAYYNRGSIYYIKGQFDRAIDDYDRAIALEPQNIDAYFYKGAACDMSGHSTEAAQAFHAFLRCAPPSELERMQKARERIAVLGG